VVLGGGVGGLVVLVSAIAGFTASLLGYYGYARGPETPVCRPGGRVGCLAVCSTPQAWIPWGFIRAPRHPAIALIGTATWREPALRILALTQWGGLLAVPYLVYLELSAARAVCAYCTIMHASTLTTALLTLDELLEALATAA
jgi:AhpD family alkylhydroperoxidase